MDREKAHEIAVQMFQREHNRWIQNALVLFGSLISTIVVGRLKGQVIPCWVLALAASIAFATVLISLSIRSTTDAWKRTIMEIEDWWPHWSFADDVRPFEIFDRHMGEQTLCKSFKDLVCPPRKILISVTRIYTLLSIAATVFFLLASISALPLWFYPFANCRCTEAALAPAPAITACATRTVLPTSTAARTAAATETVRP